VGRTPLEAGRATGAAERSLPRARWRMARQRKEWLEELAGGAQGRQFPRYVAPAAGRPMLRARQRAAQSEKEGAGVGRHGENGRQLQWSAAGENGGPTVPPPVYDFTVRGEDDTVALLEELVVGTIKISGQYTQEQVPDVFYVAKRTLTKVCGCSAIETEQSEEECESKSRVFGRIMQDINSYGARHISIDVDFWILAPAGGSANCADAVAIASFGAPEPPFDLQPIPAFRTLFIMEQRAHRNLFKLNLDDWYIGLEVPTCETLDVVRIVAHPTEFPDVVDPDKICGDFSAGNGGAGDILAQADKELVEWSNPGAICDFAGTPCMCAALQRCSWVNIGEGNMRCKGALVPSVHCGYCPFQDHCIGTDRSVICRATGAPCACAMSTAECYWDPVAAICHPSNFGEGTPCTSCNRQPICHTKIPKVQEVTPLGVPTIPGYDGDRINVTFDRIVRFQADRVDGLDLHLGSVSFACRRPPPELPKIIDIPRERLIWFDSEVPANETPVGGHQVGDILQVIVNGTINKAVTPCDLLISDRALEGMDGVQFMGMRIREYTFSLSDTAGPEIVDSFPTNNYGKAEINLEMMFRFDEAVKPAPNGQATLVRLGRVSDEVNETLRAMEPTDELIASIPLKPPVVNFLDTSVTIDFSGLLEHNHLYSIGLSPSCMQDTFGNPFAGLEPMRFVFKTVPNTIVRTLPRPEEELQTYAEKKTGFPTPILVLFGIGLLAFWLFCGIACYRLARVCSQWSRVEQEVHAEQLSPTPPTSPKKWDGTVIHAHVLSESESGSPTSMSSPKGSRPIRPVIGLRPLSPERSMTQPGLSPSSRAQSTMSTMKTYSVQSAPARLALSNTLGSQEGIPGAISEPEGDEPPHRKSKPRSIASLR